VQVSEVMTKSVDTIPQGTSLAEVAKKMKALDCGFLPVSDACKSRLIGITTDRDIVTRCVAEGKNASATPVEEAMTDRVLYCFSEDDVEQAASSMAEQQVYRLVVLDDAKSKRLVGVISMGDIRRHGSNKAAERAADRIVEAA
jgi:CBS domain-containing protein